MQDVMGKSEFIKADAASRAATSPAVGDASSPTATSGGGKLYEEKIFSVWLRQECTSLLGLGIDIKYNSAVKKISELVQSYLVSKEYRPDIWFYSVNGEFPLTYIEVLSNGDLDLTVGESERTLIDQLRLYRMFDTSCTKVRGYVVPASVIIKDVNEGLPAKAKKKLLKQNRDQDKRNCPLLMVTLEWVEDDYMFRSNLEVISETSGLLRSINDNATSNLKLVQNFNSYVRYPFFLPLREGLVKTKFGEEAFQLSSGKSIVVASESKIHKLVVSASVSIRLQQLERTFANETNERSDVNTFISISHCYDGLFFISERLIFPLSKSEARCCLQDFISLVSSSIANLHDCNFGHQDIRLENICFKLINNKIKAILIDLECLTRATDLPHRISTKSAMGVLPPGMPPNVKLLDWKQFGLMIAYILERANMTHQQYHDPAYVYEIQSEHHLYHKFVCELLGAGESYPAMQVL
jgi:hypothetical protein